MSRLACRNGRIPNSATPSGTELRTADSRSTSPIRKPDRIQIHRIVIGELSGVTSMLYKQSMDIHSRRWSFLRYMADYVKIALTLQGKSENRDGLALLITTAVSLQ